MSETKSTLRLGTRGSLLARAQSGMVADELMRRHPGLRVELVIVKTTGDQVTDKPLHELGGKGLFTKELELALLDGSVDFAVHSFKDVPVTMPLVAQAEEELILAAVPPREEPWDLLASNKARGIASLPAGARVGTGSLRRRCQLLDARRDLEIVPVRGNIDTRIRKMRDGEYDAVILALAGAKRSGLFDSKCMTAIPKEIMLPAAGQGALALQCRRDDARTRAILAPMNDVITAECVAAERALVLVLNGDCHSPIGALATIEGDEITLRAAVGAKGGELPLQHAAETLPRGKPEPLARQVAAALSG